MSRTAVRSSSGPAPAAWLRIRLIWSRATSASAIRTDLSAPNPVFTP